jgi:hypothetical protein
MSATAVMPSSNLDTPETYLGSEHSQGFEPPLKAGVHTYPGVSSLVLNEFALRGTWRVTKQSATPAASAASISLRFQAAHVYLVMTSAGNIPRRVRVLLDGRPIGAGEAGSDVHGSLVTVQGQRLYSLVSQAGDTQHDLTIEVPAGVSAYDFTFG